MKHLSQSKFDKIASAALALSALETGCRNQQKAYDRTVIELCRKYATEAGTLPKEYTVIYTVTENLGTKKWNDYHTSYSTYTVNSDETRRDTEKTAIFTFLNYSGKEVKKMIPLEKIVAYVW